MPPTRPVRAATRGLRQLWKSQQQQQQQNSTLFSAAAAEAAAEVMRHVSAAAATTLSAWGAAGESNKTHNSSLNNTKSSSKNSNDNTIRDSKKSETEDRSGGGGGTANDGTHTEQGEIAAAATGTVTSSLLAAPMTTTTTDDAKLSDAPAVPPSAVSFPSSSSSSYSFAASSVPNASCEAAVSVESAAANQQAQRRHHQPNNSNNNNNNSSISHKNNSATTTTVTSDGGDGGSSSSSSSSSGNSSGLHTSPPPPPHLHISSYAGLRVRAFMGGSPGTAAPVASGTVLSRLTDSVYAVELERLPLSPVIEIGSRVYVEYARDGQHPQPQQRSSNTNSEEDGGAGEEEGYGVVMGGVVVLVNGNGTLGVMLDNNSYDVGVPVSRVCLAKGRARYTASADFQSMVDWMQTAGVARRSDQQRMAAVLYQRGWRVDKLYLLEGSDVHCMTFIPRAVRMCVLDKSEWQRDHHRQMRQLLKERVKERDFRYKITKYSGVVSASMAFLGISVAFLWNLKNYQRQKREYQLRLAVATLRGNTKSAAAAARSISAGGDSASASASAAAVAAVPAASEDDGILLSTARSLSALVWGTPIPQETHNTPGGAGKTTHGNSSSAASSPSPSSSVSSPQSLGGNSTNSTSAATTTTVASTTSTATATTAATATAATTTAASPPSPERLRAGPLSSTPVVERNAAMLEGRQFVDRGPEEAAVRQVLRRLDTAHPRVAVFTGLFGCGKSTVCRAAMVKENLPALYVDVAEEQADTMRCVAKALGVQNLDVCGDLLDFVAEVFVEAARQMGGAVPLLVLKVREGGNFSRVYSEAVSLACDRRVCHLVIEVPLESLTMSNTSLPRLDFYTVPNFNLRQAFQYAQHSIDPVELSHFFEVAGTNSSVLDELFAAVHQRNIPASEYANIKLVKAMRQLQTALGPYPALWPAVKQLANHPYDTGMRAGATLHAGSPLRHPTLAEIVIYDTVNDRWRFESKALHTAVSCCLPGRGRHHAHAHAHAAAAAAAAAGGGSGATTVS